jgi:bifunctional N-acetylglucosamine-1-phosphate-uridyltransferase/glucosamine-1-phosphate-acetyltransferase GlmU-like protein
MIVIIMAGGLGKRMESDLPKVLHKVYNPNILDNLNDSYPMLIHVINTSIKLKPKKIFIIVGKYLDIIKKTINKFIINCDLIEYVIQDPALGTGHAIKCSLSSISNYINDRALILSGDVPLISFNTLNGLNGPINKLLVTKLDEPFGCGRILFNNNIKKIIGIKEEKDCNEEEKKIKYVNCGIYQIFVKDLINLIPLIDNNNNSNEYYLTDIIYLMIQKLIPIETFILEKNKQWEIKNVNTKKDLEILNEYIFNKFIK